MIKNIKKNKFSGHLGIIGEMKTTVAISILNRAYDFFEYRNSCTDSALAGKNKNYREIYPDSALFHPDSALFGGNSALAREMAAKYHDTIWCIISV